MFAGLVRETGLLVPMGVVAWSLFQRSFRRASWMAFSVSPTLLWYRYVNLRAPADVHHLSVVPFRGLITRLASPYPYQFGVGINFIATSLDYLALIGIMLSFLYCVWNARRLIKHPDGCIALGFAVLVILVSSQDVWRDAFSFARVFSPLLLLTALDCMRTRSLAGSVPVLITAPRIWLQFGFQVLGVLHGLWGHGYVGSKRDLARPVVYFKTSPAGASDLGSLCPGSASNMMPWPSDPTTDIGTWRDVSSSTSHARDAAG